MKILLQLWKKKQHTKRRENVNPTFYIGQHNFYLLFLFLKVALRLCLSNTQQKFKKKKLKPKATKKKKNDQESQKCVFSLGSHDIKFKLK